VLASAIASAGTCHRPWAKINEVRSWHARYLLVGRGYSVLKAWKRKRGPLLTRKVLNADVATAEWLASLGPAATIVPIPQSYTRSWQLGGSPALHIAQWLARVAPNPSIEVHASLLRPSPHAQQAQRTSLGRVSNPIRFEVQAAPRLKERMAQKPLILVDDFMTTGATLKSAARALMRDLGPVEIHVFCLGLRPSGLRRGAQAHPCANSLKRLTDEHRSL
jgi:predicted amidophosphoribosyltransferase